MNIEKCFICDKEANWLRATQFAGDHYFCEDHAKKKKEEDFEKEDSMKYWYRL